MVPGGREPSRTPVRGRADSECHVKVGLGPVVVVQGRTARPPCAGPDRRTRGGLIIETMNEHACAACGEGRLEVFLEVGAMPVHVGVLWQRAEDAQSCAKGEMRLAVCSRCGWIYNVDFDDSIVDYSQKYDNALHASPAFQDFERSLVAHLVQRYDLHGGTIGEIGCGGGHFLGLLTEAATGQGVGFDPSHDPDQIDPLAQQRVTFVRGEYPGDAPPAFDLLACRQTLEHVRDPLGFLRTIRRALATTPDTIVYFDVPNSTMPFRDLSIWDLIYEHCSYFVDTSLRFIFEAAGFEVLSLRETFEGQFLSLEARPHRGDVPIAPPDPAELLWLFDATTAFAERFGTRRAEMGQRLERARHAGDRVVVWGGGARAVSFFNLLSIREEVVAIVDMNPAKQGTFLGGTRQPIVDPLTLVDIQPELVVVLNPLYREEITSSLSGMGLHPEVVIA
jgi:SAM-dependent methyltransferase